MGHKVNDREESMEELEIGATNKKKEETDEETEEVATISKHTKIEQQHLQEEGKTKTKNIEVGFIQIQQNDEMQRIPENKRQEKTKAKPTDVSIELSTNREQELRDTKIHKLKWNANAIGVAIDQKIEERLKIEEAQTKEEIIE